MNGTQGVALLDASGRADRVAGCEDSRGEATCLMGQYVDGSGAFGALSEEIILTDSVERVFKIRFSNEHVLV